MIDKKKWSIGRRIAFNQSGLKGKGKIILHSDLSTLLVLLDEECASAGWTITYQCDKYKNQRGWWVSTNNAKLLQTKLGNSL